MALTSNRQKIGKKYEQECRASVRKIIDELNYALLGEWFDERRINFEDQPVGDISIVCLKPTPEQVMLIDAKWCGGIEFWSPIRKIKPEVLYWICMGNSDLFTVLISGDLILELGRPEEKFDEDGISLPINSSLLKLDDSISDTPEIAIAAAMSGWALNKINSYAKGYMAGLHERYQREMSVPNDFCPNCGDVLVRCPKKIHASLLSEWLTRKCSSTSEIGAPSSETMVFVSPVNGSHPDDRFELLNSIKKFARGRKISAVRVLPPGEHAAVKIWFADECDLHTELERLRLMN